MCVSRCVRGRDQLNYATKYSRGDVRTGGSDLRVCTARLSFKVGLSRRWELVLMCPQKVSATPVWQCWLGMKLAAEGGGFGAGSIPQLPACPIPPAPAPSLLPPGEHKAETWIIFISIWRAM